MPHGLKLPPENTEKETDLRRCDKGELDRGDQHPHSSADIVALIDAQSREASADREERRREDRASSFREWTTIVLLFLAFGATVIQAIIFNGQLNEMRNVYKPISEQASAASNSLMLDHRAWLGIDSIKPFPLIPEVGKDFQIGVTIKNTGRTPARKIKGKGVVDPAAVGEKPNFSYDGDIAFGAGLLSPNAEDSIVLMPVTSRSTGKTAPLTQDIFDQIQSEKIRIFVHGRVEYEDIFGTAHWFTFCAFLITPFDGHFGSCTEHNESDDYQAK